MSTEQHNKHNEPPKPPTLNRNDTELVLTEQKIGKNHDTLAGHVFYAPQGTVATWDNFVKAIGIDYLLATANRHLRKVFLTIYEDNLVDGQLDMAAWLEEAQAFTEKGGARLGDLENDLSEMQDTLQATVDEYLKCLQTGDNEKAAELQAQMQKTSDQIKPLNEAIAKQQEVFKIRVAKRKATQAKKAAEAAKAAAAKAEAAAV